MCERIINFNESLAPVRCCHHQRSNGMTWTYNVDMISPPIGRFTVERELLTTERCAFVVKEGGGEEESFPSACFFFFFHALYTRPVITRLL